MKFSGAHRELPDGRQYRSLDNELTSEILEH